MLHKAANRIRDLTHKTTRKIANAFPGATCYVGKPFNDAAHKMGRKQAQQVSSACNARLTAQLDYKSAGAREVDEAYTSQTCPVCGERAKGRRVYRCRVCGCIAPRDVIGNTNIRTVGVFGKLQTGCAVPNSVHFVYPCKYPGLPPGSSGGHPACSSREREAHPR
jgi:putative transposase